MALFYFLFQVFVFDVQAKLGNEVVREVTKQEIDSQMTLIRVNSHVQLELKTVKMDTSVDE